MIDRESSPQEVETDERFPSGPWVGFWMQGKTLGRQWMQNLWLEFREGRVKGGGSDIVGNFALRGEYEVASGSFTILKDYLGLHTVTYVGRNENDGNWLWGVWTIRAHDRGGFHIWPKGVDDPTVPRLRAAKQLQVAEPVGAR
jgi:hypothetical protein